MVKLKFRTLTPSPRPDAPERFDRARREYYQRLLQRGIPGAAWFRYQMLAGSGGTGRAGDLRTGFAVPPGLPDTDLERAFSLFSGGRAMSENLQLDRALPGVGPREILVDVASLRGIDVREFDWQPLIKDLHPETDPLAAKIPADQHAVFFPNLAAAAAVREQFRSHGTVVLRLAEPRSEDTATIARYERQLGVSLDAAAQLLGPLLVKSVALTGSDPYYPMGTDLAILLETSAPDQLATLLLARIQVAASGSPGAQVNRGDALGLAYQSVVTPDRTLSGYVATLKGCVVVTNSRYQLERLARVRANETPSLASLPEYTFFRNRYRRGDAEETALLILSDATIRRWCGPRWRIGDARRVREAARLGDALAANLDELVAGQRDSLPAGEYGTLAFLTPIAELDLQRVRQAEASAYGRWRETYQRNWTWAFDPIALRLHVEPQRLGADLTVLPLIWRTQYRQFVQVSEGVALAPDAGDPHGALAHFVLALNPRNRLFQEAGRSIERELNADGIGWLGSPVAVYLDDGPFWDELQGGGQRLYAFVMTAGWRAPLAVQFEVASSLRLAGFLSALRAYVERKWPGMTTWETRTYREQTYVQISLAPQAQEGSRSPRGFSLYYAVMSDGVLVALREDVLRRAIDRRLVRQATEQNPFAPADPQWLGDNVGLHVDRKILEAFARVWRDDYHAWMQTRAWNNLPIFNEWKRRFPNQNPLALYQKYWHARLVCPGGGDYVWNDEWQTYESTVYGHPGQPKAGPSVPPALSLFQTADFGLTFELNGLRARVALQR